MNKLFILAFLVLGHSSFGQDKKYDCIKRNNLTLEKRLGFYPFNTAKSIVLVSFSDTLNYISLKTTSFSKFQETKTLSSLQVDSLTNLLYNIGAKGNTFKYTPATCYEPRNAILFLNNNNKVFEFIEICFECYRTRVSKNNINDGISCNQKFNLIKSFFSQQGIKYGTTE